MTGRLRLPQHLQHRSSSSSSSTNTSHVQFRNQILEALRDDPEVVAMDVQERKYQLEKQKLELEEKLRQAEHSRQIEEKRLKLEEQRVANDAKQASIMDRILSMLSDQRNA